MSISKDERDKLLQAAERWVNGTTQEMAEEERARDAFVKLLDEFTDTQNEPTWLTREREREGEASIQTEQKNIRWGWELGETNYSYNGKQWARARASLARVLFTREENDTQNDRD